MAHVLAVSHPTKGGTGKSSLTLHVAGALARALADNILVADLDYGSTVSAGLGVPDDFAGPNVADAILGRTPMRDVVLRATTVPGLHLLPSTNEMEDEEPVVGKRPDSILARRLREILPEYRVALLDTHPSSGPFTRQALAAATGLLLPVMPSPESVRATRTDIQRLEAWAASMNIPIIGVVVWASDRRLRVHRQLEAALRETFGSLVFETVVRRSAVHEQSWEATQDVLGHAPSSELALDIVALTKELVVRLNGASVPAPPAAPAEAPI